VSVRFQLPYVDHDRAVDKPGPRGLARGGPDTRPFSCEIELLDTIPGVDKRAAEMLLAEIGPDMSRFPTEAHLASWGGMCPGQRESGGRKQPPRPARAPSGCAAP
jgi:transposase